MRRNNGFGYLVSLFLVIIPTFGCSAQEDKIELPSLQMDGQRYLLKGSIIVQFAQGKIVEKEGVIEIQDPLLRENLQVLGFLPLQMIPYQVKTKDKSLTFPGVYRVTIPAERDVPALCEALRKISGIQMTKPIYVNLKPKISTPYPVSNYPEFEFWDFNPTPEKNFQKAFASLSLITTEPGQWLIQPEAENESNGILRQVNPEGDADQIHLALLTPYEDHEVKIKVKVKARNNGFYKVGGVIYRFTDFANYYEVELDYSNKKMTFYRIVKGKRESLQQLSDVPLTLEKWRDLEVVNHGPRCIVFLDGVPYINQTDDSLWHGKVGLWTKADDSLTFDDFSIEAIH